MAAALAVVLVAAMPVPPPDPSLLGPGPVSAVAAQPARKAGRQPRNVTARQSGSLSGVQKGLADWLEGPVGLIATETERRMFARLEDEDERSAFIAWFWARRDPDPRTALNEFEQEFLARVELADRQINEGGPAWRSARGEVLVLFGPPDRETFNPGTATTDYVPTIIWEYNRPPVPSLANDYRVFFVDVDRRGKFEIGNIRHTNQTRFEREAAALGMALSNYVPPELERAFDEAARQSIRWPDLALPTRFSAEGPPMLDRRTEARGGAATEAAGEVSLPLPVDLRAAVGAGQLYLELRISGAALSYRQAAEGRRAVDLEVQVGAERTAGGLALGFADRVTLEIEDLDLQRIGRSHIALHYSARVDEGDYWLQVAVLDRNAGRMGRLIEHLSTSDGSSDGALIGPVSLGWHRFPMRHDGAPPGVAAVAVAEPSDGVFRAGQTLYVAFALGGLTADAQGLVHPQVEFQLIGPDELAHSHPSSVPPGRAPMLLVSALDMPRGPVGGWRLGIRVGESASDRQTHRQVSFELGEPPGRIPRK